jgi:hypothetical protein
MQIVKQLTAVILTNDCSFIFALTILWLINHFMPVNVEQENIGQSGITHFSARILILSGINIAKYLLFAGTVWRRYCHNPEMT